MMPVPMNTYKRILVTELLGMLMPAFNHSIKEAEAGKSLFQTANTIKIKTKNNKNPISEKQKGIVVILQNRKYDTQMGSTAHV